MNVINSVYPNSIRPKYMVQGGKYTLLNATTHSGASGFWSIYNPIGSTTKVYLKSVILRATQTTALVTLTAPRIGVTRFTYTGTMTSTAIPIGKIETTQPTPIANAGTSLTGYTALTAGATLASFLITGAMTAVGTGNVVEQTVKFALGEEIVLVAGEGVSFNQVDASTASDTRVVVMDAVWEEGI